jgi:hypothetical protein
MRILVACEFSGILREAFRRKGHEAWSCDILPSEKDGPHIKGDVLKHLDEDWDLMVAFPPCTHLCSSGARWFKHKKKEQEQAIDFVRQLAAAPVPKIAIENPVGVLSTRWRKPDQYVQPWWFGHGEVKTTCLWLKNLSPLIPTNSVNGREPRVHYASPKPDRWKERSRILTGFAEAIAAQWGAL